MPHKDPISQALYLKEYRCRNRDRIRTGQKSWTDRNREYVRESQREKQYKNRYGITVADYDRMLLAQGGRCAICKTDKSLGRGRFHVDHDHATGRVRGILCHLCNTALGRIEKYDWQSYLHNDAYDLVVA